MGVRIRLSRFGCIHRPFYRIVVADGKSSREGRHIEVLGFYNPITVGEDSVRDGDLKLERLKYWLSVGAQPSDTVKHIISRAGLLPEPRSTKNSANAIQSNGGVDEAKAKEVISVDDLLCLSIPIDNQASAAYEFQGQNLMKEISKAST